MPFQPGLAQPTIWQPSSAFATFLDRDPTVPIQKPPGNPGAALQAVSFVPQPAAAKTQLDNSYEVKRGLPGVLAPQLTAPPDNEAWFSVSTTYRPPVSSDIVVPRRLVGLDQAPFINAPTTTVTTTFLAWDATGTYAKPASRAATEDARSTLTVAATYQAWNATDVGRARSSVQVEQSPLFPSVISRPLSWPSPDVIAARAKTQIDEPQLLVFTPAQSFAWPSPDLTKAHMLLEVEPLALVVFSAAAATPLPSQTDIVRLKLANLEAPQLALVAAAGTATPSFWGQFPQYTDVLWMPTPRRYVEPFELTRGTVQPSNTTTWGWSNDQSAIRSRVVPDVLQNGLTIATQTSYLAWSSPDVLTRVSYAHVLDGFGVESPAAAYLAWPSPDVLSSIRRELVDPGALVAAPFATHLAVVSTDVLLAIRRLVVDELALAIPSTATAQSTALAWGQDAIARLDRVLVSLDQQPLPVTTPAAPWGWSVAGLAPSKTLPRTVELSALVENPGQPPAHFLAYGWLPQMTDLRLLTKPVLEQLQWTPRGTIIFINIDRLLTNTLNQSVLIGPISSLTRYGMGRIRTLLNLKRRDRTPQ